MAVLGKDPLATCLMFVARWHRITTTMPALIAGLPLEDSRLSVSLLRRAANRIGLSCRLHKLVLGDIPSALMPAILVQHDGRACVLLSYDAEKACAEVVYPELDDAAVTVPIDKIAASYSGNCALLSPRFRFDSHVVKPSTSQPRHWFWGVLLDNAPVYRDVLFAALLINLFALASPLFVMNVYDRVVSNFAVETLWALAIGMLIVIVLDVIMRTMRGYFLDIAGQRADVKISASIMEKLLGLRLESRPPSVGAFAANLRSFEMVRDFLASATIASLIDLPFALLFIVVIGWLALPLTVPLLVAIAVVIGYSLLASRRLRGLAETSTAASAQRNATLVETLVGLETLKAMGAESHMQRRWERGSSFLSRVTVQLRLLAASTSHVAIWAQQTAYVSVIVMGVYLIADAELTLGGLIACSILTSRAMSPFGQLAGLITQYHNAVAAMDTLNGIMEQPVERPVGSQFLSRKQLRGDLEFNNVSFCYPGSDIAVIRNISLKIRAGERVGVLGKVGSGKSTLQRLMMGLYQASSGAVLVDGIDIRQLDPADLRFGMGYVPQDVTLFMGSLRDNLLMGHPQLGDSSVLAALDLAGMGDFVKSHPQGLDMAVGERGEALSGGQRKAMSLARGLVHKPRILLLDEPTSSMDHSTEQQVKRKLKEYCGDDKTMLLITHHTSLLELVDRIIVMDAGKIVADGPREQVVEALRKGRISGAP
ncbi:type I secretion system permease/ATPase [Spongiibacter sp.]|uniref:type I secretion system permease/ATPase n=1 Tax=Spongiibacter sp. TaxID=2024860 RepID=UPI003563393D